jgi:uncharacterized protein (DUF885 family)
MSRDSVVDAVDDYVAVLAQHEPTAAQAIGVEASLLPDLSPEWAEERRRLDEHTRDLVAARAPASPAENGLSSAVIERLSSDMSLFDVGFTPRLLAPLATPIHLLRETFDGVTLGDDASGARSLAQLGELPDAVAQLQRRLAWARDSGTRFTGGGVVARRQVLGVIGQVRSWVGPGSIDYFSRLLTTASTVQRSAAERAIGAAEQSFLDFAEFLETEILPAAPSSDAVGDEVYSATAESFLGASLDLDEIYDYGWDELLRLHADATAVARRITGRAGATIRDAVAALDADGPRLHGQAEIAAWLEQRVAETISDLGTHFVLPADIGQVHCDVTAAASGVVYYTPGAPDGSRSPRIVWTISEDDGGITTWREVTSVHHEGAPGHHLEHSINRANASLHPWQRYLCEIHGYAEGWAHYSEGLADELGLIRNDGERLGMLLGMLWRSVRIVADLGIHTGRPIPRNSLFSAPAWNDAVARRALSELALVNPVTAQFEVDRYFGWPGQALAFKVGAKLWQETRERSEAELGDSFSLRDFHSAALELGPMGLGPLASEMKRQLHA